MQPPYAFYFLETYLFFFFRFIRSSFFLYSLQLCHQFRGIIFVTVVVVIVIIVVVDGVVGVEIDGGNGATTSSSASRSSGGAFDSRSFRG